MKGFSRHFILWLLAIAGPVSGLSQYLSVPDGLHSSDFRNQLIAVKENGRLVSDPSISNPIISGLKKPAIGVLFSAAIPGAGEMYAGSWLKGALLLGAEVVLWMGYKHYSNKGQEWDDAFHVYADEHWSEPRYWVYIAGTGEPYIAGVDEINYTVYLEQLRAKEHDNYSHGLHAEKDQQYYEMIGKYDQFVAGWDDYQKGQPDLTPKRNHYLDMRDNSNKQFKNASACVMAVLANHVLSAFDAAWAVKSKNRRIESKFRTGLKQIENRVLPTFSMQFNW